jgi:hypothetical protein
MAKPCDTAKRVFGPVDVCPANDAEGCALCRKPGSIGERYRDEIKERCGPAEFQIPEQETLSRDLQAFIRGLGCNFVSGDAIALAAMSAEKILGREGFYRQVMLAFRENRPSYQQEFMG